MSQNNRKLFTIFLIVLRGKSEQFAQWKQAFEIIYKGCHALNSEEIPKRIP